MKPYPKYKPSGVEWLGDIPSHWEIIKTKYLFRLVTDPAPTNNDYELLSLYTDIGVKPRKELEERGNKATTTDGYWIVKKGDIIVNKLLAWMGAIGISDYDGVTSPAYDVLRKVKPLNERYYDYLFRCGIYLPEFKRRSRGIMEMRLRLYFDQFGQIPLVLPPIWEQNAIVYFLEHKSEQIDCFIANREKLIELLKEQRTAIINNAVTKGIDPDVKLKPSGIEWLGDIPEHWEVRKLKYLVNLISEQTTQKEDNEIYVALENIESWSGKLTLNQENIVFESIVKRFQKDDVLFGKLRPYLAKAILSNQRGVCVSELLVLRSKKNLYPEFLLYKVLNRNFIDLVDNSTYGSKMPRANWNFIGNIKITIPNSIEEQRAIVSYIKTQTSKIDAAIIQSEKEIKLIKEYRQTLIADAVTGKIDVRDED